MSQSAVHMLVVGVEESTDSERRDIKIVRVCGRVSHVPTSHKITEKIIISYHLYTAYMLL